MRHYFFADRPGPAKTGQDRPGPARTGPIQCLPKRHLLQRKDNRDKYIEANEGKEQNFKKVGLKILKAQQITKIVTVNESSNVLKSILF